MTLSLSEVVRTTMRAKGISGGWLPLVMAAANRKQTKDAKIKSIVDDLKALPSRYR